jgi:hypothetical protein
MRQAPVSAMTNLSFDEFNILESSPSAYEVDRVHLRHWHARVGIMQQS